MKKGNKISEKRENVLLKEAVSELKLSSEGKIELNGALYTKVAKRIEVIRDKFGFDVQIKTQIKTLNETSVLTETIISLYKDNKWIEIANGHAEKIRDSSEITKFAAVEVAETASIGRALACLGLSGAEHASYEEMTKMGAGAPPSVKDNASYYYMMKLLKQTSSDPEVFLSYFGVKKFEDMGESSILVAIEKLKLKEKKVKKNQSQTSDILNVLNENKFIKKSTNNNNKTKSSSVTAFTQKENEYNLENKKKDVLKNKKNNNITKGLKNKVDEEKKEKVVKTIEPEKRIKVDNDLNESDPILI